jgi:hypothetical protein
VGTRREPSKAFMVEFLQACKRMLTYKLLGIGHYLTPLRGFKKLLGDVK